MWGFLASALDEMVALNLRWSQLRHTPHLTDIKALESALADLEPLRPREIFPICPAPEASEVSLTAPVKGWGGEIVDALLPSAWPTRVPNNQTMPVRIVFPPGKTWGTPMVLLLHPWVGPGIGIMHQRHGSHLIKRGIAVALPILPHHFQRRSPRRWSGELTICGNLVRMLDTARQTMVDIDRVSNWLRIMGTETLGITGVSLGGGVAAMQACLDEQLAFCAPIIPPSDTAHTLRVSALTKGPIRNDFERSGVSDELFDRALKLMSPGRFSPLLPADRLLVVGSSHDRIIPPETFGQLAEHWGCELWMMPHGHCSLFLSRKLGPRFGDWVRERM